MAQTAEEFLQTKGVAKPTQPSVSGVNTANEFLSKIGKTPTGITSPTNQKQVPFSEREGFLQTLFKSPIELGRDLARLTPEYKEAVASQERLRVMAESIKNSPLDTRAKQVAANILDQKFPLDNVFPTKDPSQYLGDILGTALFVVPVGQVFKGLQGVSIASQVARGATVGGAFGLAESLSDGDDIGGYMKNIAIGTVAGGVIEPLAIGALKAVRAIVNKIKGVTVEAAKQPVVKAAIHSIDQVGNRIATHYGAEGKEIAERLYGADRSSRIKIGTSFQKLADKGVTQLSDEQAWRGPNSLLNILEGRAPATTLEKVASGAREILNDAAKIAQDLKVTIKTTKGVAEVPFTPRQNYFPHISPSLDRLKSGRIRQETIESAVNRGVFKNAQEASGVLDSYISFVEQNGRGGQFWINWLVKSGQAKSLDEARGMTLRYFKTGTLKKFGQIEKARELDFPFYDPDPRRVLPTYLAGAYTRLGEIGQFGQKSQKLNALLGKVSRLQGRDAAVDLRNLIKIATGQIEKSLPREKLSLWIRAVQVPKLAFAQILNIGQSINTVLVSDTTSTLKGIAYAFSNKGVRRALESGATLENVFNETHRALGVDTEFGEKFLRYVGFTATEKFNRTVAANAGISYAESTLQKLIKNPTNPLLQRRLSELKIDAAQAITRGFLLPEEKLMAAQMMTEFTQFRGRPLDLPAFASSPEGKVLFQFKNFAYQQTILLKKRIVDETKKGNYGGVMRDLFVLGTLFPMVGEVLGDIRSLVSGTRRPTNFLDRYLNNLMQVGGFGIIADAFNSIAYGRLLEFFAGPGVSTGVQLSEKTFAVAKRGSLSDSDIKFLLAQTGFGRALGNYAFPSNKKDQATFLDTLINSF